MDLSFEKAASKYYDIVKNRCELLLRHILKNEKKVLTDKYDLYIYLRENKISFYQYDNKRYFFHGCGCTVFDNDVVDADWDFGYRSLWCGIDPYKMAITLKNNNYDEVSYHDADFIKKMCETYLFQKDMFLYNNQYYIDLLKKETIHVAFPQKYDSLIIRRDGKEIRCDKSKDIDRFIRKSREIYKDIEKLENNYELVFMSEGQEIFKVLYNDIAYQDSAVEIMTNRILKHICLNKNMKGV